MVEWIRRGSMKWLWTPLLLCFAVFEYVNLSPVCGSGQVTGQMWFMWLVMSIMSSRLYYEKVCRCL